MKELVEVIAKALVDDPESVVVNEREEKKTTVLEVRVAESDMGKVIGKQGRIAKAIRTCLKSCEHIFCLMIRNVVNKYNIEL